MPKTHITLEGEEIKLERLTTSHLINIINIKSRKCYSPVEERHLKRLKRIEIKDYIKELNKRFNNDTKPKVNKLPKGMYSEEEVITLLHEYQKNIRHSPGYGLSMEYLITAWLPRELKKIK